MRKAIVKDGKVQNIVLVEVGANWRTPFGTIAVTLPDNSPAGIGWTYDGVFFKRGQPSVEELAATASAQKVLAAKERAVKAIKENATGAPWGIILNDVAIAMGLIEPE